MYTIHTRGVANGQAAVTRAGAMATWSEDPSDFVSTDVAALASHMSTCKQSRGHLHSLRSNVDLLRVLVSSRIVSTGALFGLAGLALLLYLA
jgi:hypothetical protein